MTMLDMEIELRHYLATARRHRHELHVRPIEALDGYMVGAVRADYSGGTWQPVEDGERSVVVPIRRDERATGMNGCQSAAPFAMAWSGVLVDLVAWPINQPERWALRRGVAQFVGHAGPQWLKPEPVAITRTPARWLHALFDHPEAGAICFLEDDPAFQQEILFEIDGLIPEDAEHGRELDAVRRWQPARTFPRMFIATPALEAAE